MISHIFSFLDVETLLRARLNKRLDDIVLKSKCYVKEMLIVEVEEVRIHWYFIFYDLKNINKSPFNYLGIYFRRVRARITIPMSRKPLFVFLHELFLFSLYVNLVKDRSYSVDCIRRLTQNLSIGTLTVNVSETKVLWKYTVLQHGPCH